MSKKYALVFEGLVAEGKDVGEVKANLIMLFGVTVEKAESMFRPGVRIQIKRDLDYDGAVAAKASFERSGALCRIIETYTANEAPPTAPPPAAATTAPPPSPDSLLAAPRRFYLLLPLRLLISITPVAMLLSLKLLPFKVSQMPVEGAAVLTALFILSFLLVIFAVWRMWQPVLTLSMQGVEQKLSRFFTTDFAPWNNIQGMTVNERTVQGKIQKMVKLLITTGEGKARESVFGITGLDGGEEALTILRQIVPERRPADFSRPLQHLKPLQTETMRYRDIELTREGIVRRRETIPWERITSISTEGLVIAGYGPVAVGYAGKGNGNKFAIRASISEEYLDCIKLILSKACNASVDPGIIGMLEYPVEAAKKDVYPVLLIVTGVLLSVGGLIVLSFYPPTVGSTWLYPLLLLPLALAPLLWTLKLVGTRFQGGAADPSRKIVGAALFNLGAVLSVAILFSLSPASFLWLLADAATLTGRMEKAEQLYMRAEPALGKNEDYIFTLGQFYSRKGDWNRAAGYYISSYEKDPTNWMPEPLANIPDSLSKAGRHEEALRWCERIARQYAGNLHVTGVIERRRKEIVHVLEAKSQAVTVPETTAETTEVKP
ncbi:MAG: tetratricopeptide repeat protein [Geobacteraceae bacterium]|nr:tetratricopeptide repeat protein [Geobacteraceae bacterium]